MGNERNPEQKLSFSIVPIEKYSGAAGVRFEAKHEFYQKNLLKLAKDWHVYLQKFLETTGHLFGASELPWLQNERVLVSSLAASIVSQNPMAIIAEEIPVTKLAGSSNKGRCDLWAHIPSTRGDSFNFYMEVKRCKLTKTDDISAKLRGRGGISRMLDDYAKSRGGGNIDQRSPYVRNDRPHDHCVIGMICIPLTGFDRQKIGAVKQQFCDSYKCIYETANNKGRKIQRYPSMGFVFASASGDAMLVGMTVLGDGSRKKYIDA